VAFTRNETGMTAFSRAATEGFAKPPTTEETFTAPDQGGQHAEILENFAQAILRGAPLLAPATEGLPSVELANAMILSAWSDQTVSLPLDATRYEAALMAKIAASAVVKTKKTGLPGNDFSKSFQ
jgi:hypothetical protein